MDHWWNRRLVTHHGCIMLCPNKVSSNFYFHFYRSTARMYYSIHILVKLVNHSAFYLMSHVLECFCLLSLWRYNLIRLPKGLWELSLPFVTMSLRGRSQQVKPCVTVAQGWGISMVVALFIYLHLRVFRG